MTIKNQTAANTIAEALSNGLTHPGAENRQAANFYLPALDPRGKPTHMAEAIKAINQTLAESIIHLIEQNSTIIPTTELNQLHKELKEARKRST